LADFRTVFIRAPVVSGVTNSSQGMDAVGPEVQPGAPLQDGVTISAACENTDAVNILHTLENGLVVAARQGNKLGTSFHPELSGDCRFHAWFLQEFVVNARA
ncbi:hypothetical protein OXX59_009218, partial [Metschnikowia pulcherrima]